MDTLSHQHHNAVFDEEFLTSLYKPMIAGSCAGISEHLCMFPVDTIKTRMQTASFLPNVPMYKSVPHGIMKISLQEGIPRLYRGVSATVTAAIPSHAFYFATYEIVKQALGCNTPGYHVAGNAMAGGCAIMVHDSIVTPLDVIKQRLQVYNSTHRHVIACAKDVIKREGFRTLYASYPVTILMNVPFMAVHFATYDTLKTALTSYCGHFDVPQEILAGGGAGALGGLLSTPLDVIKTRIQTQNITCNYGKTAGCVSKNNGFKLCKIICREEGLRGFTRGASARVFYFMPSAAIVWTTYETIKRVFGFDPGEMDLCC